jgi:hypothetical protein
MLSHQIPGRIEHVYKNSEIVRRLLPRLPLQLYEQVSGIQPLRPHAQQ